MIFILLNDITSEAAGKCTGVKLATTQRKIAVFLKTVRASNKAPWENYRNVFSGNRECMSIFETTDFGEASRKLVMDHWKIIGSLKKYETEDKKFYEFVISAFEDETAPIEDIKAIHINANMKCPPGAEPICKEILDKTQSTKQNL